MKQLASRLMHEGAWGLVTRFESGGPEYPDDVIEVAKVIASLGGIYTSHVGSEGMSMVSDSNGRPKSRGVSDSPRIGKNVIRGSIQRTNSSISAEPANTDIRSVSITRRSPRVIAWCTYSLLDPASLFEDEAGPGAVDVGHGAWRESSPAE